MGKKIMVVDDSSSIRALIASALNKEGYDVLEAEDGADALEKLIDQANSVDMMITDLNMPRLDGIHLIERFRKIPGYRFIPVVMLTTESQEEKRREGKAAGASAWLTKPFKPEQLLGLVRMVLV
jgi:two-component system, chemotaxis family, chemotaxis protein CheY